MLTGNDFLTAVQNLPSMTEQEELLKLYKEEIDRCWKLAQQLDSLYPQLHGTFTGIPSKRIERQLYALGVLK